MLELRSCLKTEHRSATELSKSIFKDNMEEQFPLLLGIDNTDRMFVASDNGNIASMVNYYPAKVRLNTFTTKVGSIGSVCTSESYRHQSLASKLLSLAEQKMLSEQIRIAIISGEGGIYKKFGSNQVGNVIARIIHRNQLTSDPEISLRQYEDKDFDEVYKMYQQESLCYIRGKEEFKSLIKGQTTPDTYCDYPFILVYYRNQLRGYVICNRTFGKRSLLMKEIAGDRQIIKQAIQTILIQYKKFNITILADPTDKLNSFLQDVPSQVTHLHASVKIIDLEGFIQDMLPYITQKTSKDIARDLAGSIVQGEYTLFYQGKPIVHLNSFDFNEMVFGKTHKITKNLDSFAKTICEQLFPIPFVWPNNLNYQ